MAMSGDITDQIQNDLLNCKICLSRFIQPKMLPCAHTYCQGCLEKMVRPDQKVQCPECREEFDVGGGVSKLKTNFHINSLMDIFKSKENEKVVCSWCATAGLSEIAAVARCKTCLKCLCPPCKLTHGTANPRHVLEDLPGHVAGPCEAETKMQKMIYCRGHPGTLVDYLCNTCNSVICSSCSSHAHAKHSKVSLVKAGATERPTVMNLMERLKTDTQSLVQQEDDITQAMEGMKATERSLMSMIECTLAEVINNLIKQGDTIKDTLSSYVREQEELYKVARDDIQLKIKKAKNTREFSQGVLDSGKMREIVCLRSVVEEQIDGLQAPRVPDDKKTRPSLTVNESFKSMLSHSNLFSLTFGEESAAKAVAAPANSEPLKSPAKSPQAYTPLPQPKQRAWNLHCFHTELGGDEYDPKLTGVSVSYDGIIVVADEDNSLLKCFIDCGDHTISISLPDDDEPCSVAIFDDTIACSSGNQLYMLDMDGTMQKKLFLRGFESVYPLAAYQDEYVAVSEGSMCSLSLYNINGQVVDRVKPYGYEGVRFLFLAINSYEQFIVADCGKQCILIFERDGCLFTICDQVTMNGVSQAISPYSICTDKDDNILVTERNRILLFWPNGDFCEELLTVANGLHKPHVITVDNYNNLVVTQGNGFITVYQLDLS
ncbi:E3 ubiquitin-protein ligase TRIM56-like [Amblyraja radiata]|uniref:E3 ubiquitin-protein ligase TRIM56-like n=1 Tax=Amblyraja radiata TaxID=386614 RepID=UPI0014023CBA|nr:E3 ubiquitin-protein ligase TRIM56-like [Amblyraja radiata]